MRCESIIRWKIHPRKRLHFHKSFSDPDHAQQSSFTVVWFSENAVKVCVSGQRVATPQRVAVRSRSLALLSTCGPITINLQGQELMGHNVDERKRTVLLFLCYWDRPPDKDKRKGKNIRWPAITKK